MDAFFTLEHKVERGILLNIVVGQSAPVLQLLAGENQALLIRRDALLVLDLGLDGLNRVAGLCVQSDGLAGQGLHENLHMLSLL